MQPACWFNPVALRKAKIVYNFGLSECNRVNTLRVSDEIHVGEIANSVALDKAAHDEPSHQDLHFYTICSYKAFEFSVWGSLK